MAKRTKSNLDLPISTQSVALLLIAAALLLMMAVGILPFPSLLVTLAVIAVVAVIEFGLSVRDESKRDRSDAEADSGDQWYEEIKHHTDSYVFGEELSGSTSDKGVADLQATEIQSSEASLSGGGGRRGRRVSSGRGSDEAEEPGQPRRGRRSAEKGSTDALQRQSDHPLDAEADLVIENPTMPSERLEPPARLEQSETSDRDQGFAYSGFEAPRHSDSDSESQVSAEAQDAAFATDEALDQHMGGLEPIEVAVVGGEVDAQAPKKRGGFFSRRKNKAKPEPQAASEVATIEEATAAVAVAATHDTQSQEATSQNRDSFSPQAIVPVDLDSYTATQARAEAQQCANCGNQPVGADEACTWCGYLNVAELLRSAVWVRPNLWPQASRKESGQ